MSLRIDDAGPSYLVRGALASLEISVRTAGALVAPTGGAWKLINSSGTVLAGGAVTVTGDKATYSIGSVDWAGSEAYGAGYVEQWALEFAAYDNRSFDRLVSVVPVQPYCPVSGRDLQRVHSDIFSEAPTADPGWEDKIELAWRLTLARITAAPGMAVHEVADWSAFMPYLLALTEHHIGKDLSTEERGAGKWTTIAIEAKAQAEAEWGRLGYAVDADADRVPDETGNLQTTGAGGYLGVPGEGRRW